MSRPLFIGRFNEFKKDIEFIRKMSIETPVPYACLSHNFRDPRIGKTVALKYFPRCSHKTVTGRQ